MQRAWPTANPKFSPRMAPGVAVRRRRAHGTRLAGGDPVPQPRLSLGARRFGQRRARTRLVARADPDRGRRRASARRRARLSQDATARANMCSTTAGPTRGSGPAGNIIPSCRSRCRSRRCRARGCSGHRPQQLLAAAEAVTVQNDLSSAHITFIDEAGAAECERRGWLIRHGIQYHWFNRGYASFDDFLAALSSRKRKAIRKERAARSRGARVPRAARRAKSAAPSGTRCGPSTRTPARASGASPISRASSSTSSASGWATGCCCSSPAATAGRSPARSISSGPTRFTAAIGARIDEVPFLHFELCYYQAVEWAIEHGLTSVQAGAQGEHKVARGYEPVITRSAHFIPQPELPRRGRRVRRG